MFVPTSVLGGGREQEAADRFLVSAIKTGPEQSLPDAPVLVSGIYAHGPEPVVGRAAFVTRSVPALPSRRLLSLSPGPGQGGDQVPDCPGLAGQPNGIAAGGYPDSGADDLVGINGCEKCAESDRIQSVGGQVARQYAPTGALAWKEVDSLREVPEGPHQRNDYGRNQLPANRAHLDHDGAVCQSSARGSPRISGRMRYRP